MILELFFTCVSMIFGDFGTLFCHFWAPWAPLAPPWVPRPILGPLFKGFWGPSGTLWEHFWSHFMMYFFATFLGHLWNTYFTDFRWIFDLILGAFWGHFLNKLILWKSRSRLHGNLDREGPGGPKNYLFSSLFSDLSWNPHFSLSLSILGLILAPRWESRGQLFDMFSHLVFLHIFYDFQGPWKAERRHGRSPLASL